MPGSVLRSFELGDAFLQARHCAGSLRLRWLRNARSGGRVFRSVASVRAA